MNEIKPASERIIEYVGAPTRWRTLDVLNQKRRVYKKIFKQLEPELKAHEHAILKDYNIQIDLRENELKTQEARKEIDTNDLFTPVQQAKLKKALLEAYQGRAENIESAEVLLAAVAKVGLPVGQARAILQSKEYETEVRALEEFYRGAGIHAVPAVIINDRHLISGGQPTDVFERALREIAAATL